MVSICIFLRLNFLAKENIESYKYVSRLLGFFLSYKYVSLFLDFWAFLIYYVSPMCTANVEICFYSWVLVLIKILVLMLQLCAHVMVISLSVQLINSYLLQAHAASAILNFTENCTPEILTPYLDGIVHKLLLLLQVQLHIRKIYFIQHAWILCLE